MEVVRASQSFQQTLALSGCCVEFVNNKIPKMCGISINNLDLIPEWVALNHDLVSPNMPLSKCEVSVAVWANCTGLLAWNGKRRAMQ